MLQVQTGVGPRWTKIQTVSVNTPDIYRAEQLALISRLPKVPSTDQPLHLHEAPLIMPNTMGQPNTTGQPDPRWKDDPRWNNPSHLRACAEEAHYERLRKALTIPLYIHPDPQAQTTYQVPHLSAKDCRDFCWKDCVIYGNAGLTAHDHHALLEEVYREWYPHRATDKDVSDGSFFGKFMRFIPPSTHLVQIIRFHAALCEKLSSLMPEIEDLEPAIPHAVPPKEETRRVGSL